MTATTHDVLSELSIQTGQALSKQGLTLSTAESCTGGWVAEVVTATAGSSAWFDRGFVTYSNQAKTDMLGVRTDTIGQFGAVSEATALEMASGAIQHSTADWAIAITGIAGPGGGSSDKPVGTVCFAWCKRNTAPTCSTQRFSGDRYAVRQSAVIYALQQLISRIET